MSKEKLDSIILDLSLALDDLRGGRPIHADHNIESAIMKVEDLYPKDIFNPVL